MRLARIVTVLVEAAPLLMAADIAADQHGLADGAGPMAVGGPLLATTTMMVPIVMRPPRISAAIAAVMALNAHAATLVATTDIVPQIHVLYPLMG